MCRTLVCLLCSVLLACSSTPFFGSLSPQAAQREADRDIASGRMKIYVTGTRAAFPFGVGTVDQAVVAHLRRDHSLPSGCTVPHVDQAMEYARVYNRAIIHYLRSHPQT
jgi:hypothetical protein